ncbi:helix-turn-helix domain-containing protein [Paenibacillus sp. D51F]
MNQNIGQHLEALRMSCGYSLREAAKRSGLSHGYIRDVELGVNRKSGAQMIPMPQTLRKFADAYRANYNDLMRIAGHFETTLNNERPYELIEIDLNRVLYIQVDEDNRVNYHMQDSVFTEGKSLHEYMILEEKLENAGFSRVQSGIYANLNQARTFDEKNGRIFFDENMAGKFVEISWIRAQKFRSSIKRAIANNNNLNMEIKIECNSKLSMVIRNIVH